MTLAVAPDIERLNEGQKKAVLTTDGRVLILAGAGSGKTMVLTMRMVHLVRDKGVFPENILGLTFTNKAAAEMRHRVAATIGKKSSSRMTLCTFHSFCMRVLRQEIHRLGYTSQFTIYNEKDVQRVVNNIAREMLGRDGELPSLAATMQVISRLRNSGQSVEELEKGDNPWHDDFAFQLYKKLQESMRAFNAVDFDSLLCLTVELFEQYPDILERYQEQFRYIMIDEYQDTNPIQYRLASLLSEKYDNLCVVGDDDQSIYGWRGADVKNILRFEAAVPIKLEQNYRSTNTILKAANAVIENNTERHGKALWSSRGDGQQIEMFHAPDELNEAQAVACRIAALKEREGLQWKDIAILYRSNALSRQLEMALMKHSWKHGPRWIKGIPYQIFGGVEFYERREVKDLAAYLRVIVNPQDQEALLRVVNQPRRGIGEGSLDALTQCNRSNKIPLWNVLTGVNSADPNYMTLREKMSRRALNGIAEFIAAIEGTKQMFASGRMDDALRWLIERIDYQKAIKEEVKSEQMRAFKWENVQEFMNAMSEYENSGEGERSLVDFIASVTLDKSKDVQKTEEDADRVNLMTFHSAKGLEFKACFLVGIEDHIIPHEKSLQETGVEEERRLMYVAITRAKERLTISMARKRNKMGQAYASKPSRFLYEIPKDLYKLTQWHEV